MKRCRNCGWANDDAAVKCAKCGHRLPAQPDAEAQDAGGACVPPCPRCGYPVSSLLRHCPVCHALQPVPGQANREP